MKVQVSHRLDEALLAWATEYGESRRVSRAVVIEEALKHFKELSKGGVPDLHEPEEATPRVVASPRPQTREEIMKDRQRALARSMGWAS